MTSSLSIHDKDQRELSNDVSTDRAIRKAKPTEGRVLVLFVLTNPDLHTTAYCISLHILHFASLH